MSDGRGHDRDDPDAVADAILQASAVKSDRDDSVEASVESENDELRAASGTDSQDADEAVRRRSEIKSCDGSPSTEDAREERAKRDRESLREPIPTIRPSVHELGAKLLFTSEDHSLLEDGTSDLSDEQLLERHDEDALAPFWAMVKQWEPTLPEDIDPFGAIGHAWRVLPYEAEGGTKCWESGLAADGESYERYYEYQVGLRAQDSVGERKAVFQFKISRPLARHYKSGDLIQSMPNDLPFGLRVQVDSSNIHPDDVLTLLRRLFDEMGINSEYIADDRLHPWSSCYNLALYARVDRTYGERYLAQRNGLIDRLAKFGMGRGRGEYKWDNEEVVGKRNAVVLDADTWEQLLPGEQIAMLLKYYHPKQVRSESTTADKDALRDPKVEVQRSSEYADESLPWHSDEETDVSDAISKMDTALVNAFSWSGMPTRAGAAYTADEYFQAEEDTRDIEIIDSPLDDIEESEQDIAFENFSRGDATSAERMGVVALADGGDGVHVDELAERAGISPRSIRRMGDRYTEVLEIVNGLVSFNNDVVRERFEELLSTFTDATDWISRRARDLVDRAERGDLSESAVGRWARQHLGSVSSSADGQLVDLSGRPVTEPKLKRMLRRGFRAARADGVEAARRFVFGTSFRWTAPSGETVERENVVMTNGTGLVRILGRNQVDLPAP
ncbi:hypothetical protein [Haloprofundus halobius]|uniref:DUF7845 domain-containing protein n=1 Tax=Haloprofundus halobius TaxID=2876194 RepID=UPI001CCDFA01|nr:hypothetical protein [Haloprofundus halobius]